MAQVENCLLSLAIESLESISVGPRMLDPAASSRQIGRHESLTDLLIGLCLLEPPAIC